MWKVHHLMLRNIGIGLEVGHCCNCSNGAVDCSGWFALEYKGCLACRDSCS